MISTLIGLASSGLLVGLRPATQPIAVRAHHGDGEHGGVFTAPPMEELSQMYRARWSGDSGKAATVPTWLKSVNDELLDTRALPDVACVVDGEGEICGPVSFDSVDGGMLCVEDTSGEVARWVCA